MQSYYSDINTTGKVQSDAQGVLIGAVSTMPADAKASSGVTLLYTGPSNDTYTKGKFYTSDGSSWNPATLAGVAGLTYDRVLISSDKGELVASNITTGELGNLAGLTTPVQEKLASLTKADNNLTEALGKKVDAVTGKGLSANDFTDDYKTKLDGIADSADVNTIESIKVNGTAVEPDASKVVDISISIPTKISQLSNDKNYIDATALSGYATESFVMNEIGKISTFDVQIITEFPTTDISTTTIYLKGAGAEGNVYEEFLYVNGKWELIGNTAVSLDGYVTSGALTAALEGYVPTSRKINGNDLTGDIELTASDVGAATASDIETAVQSKQDTITGSASSITTTILSKGMAVVTNTTTGMIEASPVSATELGYLDGVTSSVQDQLNDKLGVNDKAKSAATADSATSATTADKATTADSATTAGSATKATQDGSGNVITSTYATKTELSGKLATDGTAAKATADASGNTITTTYATKAELNAKRVVTLVDSLPAATSVTVGDIYSIPDEDGEDDNLRKEYYSDGMNWELIGGSGGAGVSFFLTGKVTLSQGVGTVDGVTVTATSASHTASATTNSNGEYSIEVKQGQIYSVAGSKTNYRFTNPSTTVTINELTNTAPDITCYQLGSVKVTVTGASVSGRSVGLTGQTAQTTDGTGVVTFSGIEPGSYTATCNYPEGYGIDSGSKSVTVTAGTQATVSFNILARPTVKVTVTSQHGSNSGLTIVATPASGTAVEADTNSSGVATMTVDAGKTYSFDVKSVPTDFVDVTAVTGKTFTAGTTNNAVGLTMQRKPQITVTNNDEEGNAISVTVNGSTQSIAKGSSYTWTLPSAGTYAITAATPSGASGVTITPSSSVTATLDGVHSATVAGVYVVVYAMNIAVGTSDPKARCTYPSSVTIGGKSYTPANANYTPADGTTLNSWATDYNSGTGLISGIEAGTLSNGAFTPATDKSKVPAGSTSADAMTKVPTWWFKMTNDGTTIQILFANQQLDGFKDYAGSWGTVRKGVFYIGCHLAYQSGSKIYSMASGPTGNISYQDTITQCTARGTGYDLMNWQIWTYLGALTAIMWRSTDLQNAFASGISSGSKTNNAASSTNEYGMAGMKGNTGTRMTFFWINDLWGNYWQWCGAHIDSSKHLQFNTMASSISTWDYTGSTVGNGNGSYISKVSGTTADGFFPTEISGSGTTYFADGGLVYASYFPRVGGGYNSGDYCGPFFAYFSYYASASDSNYVGRLSFRHPS